MIERDTVLETTQEAPAPAQAPRSAGAMLRQLRESAGVDAALVASAMKVSPQKLEALENDRLDELPDVTFARGLAAAVCRAFGADPAPVLERMPLAAAGLRQSEHAINQPFRRVSDRPTPMGAGSLPKPLLLVVGALLIGAAVLWFLPTLPIQLDSPPPTTTPVAPDGRPGEGAGEQAAAPTPAEMPVGAASAEQGTPPVAARSASAPASAMAPASAASAAGAGSDLLSFTANGESWITVRDAAGKNLVNRAVRAGEVLNVTGNPPLSVTIGRKDAVTVSVRGQPFDHRSLGPSSVARFQVK